MDIEDIEKLVDGDPDTLIQKAEELGIDFSSLDEDIARTMVQQRFSLTNQQFKAVDFVFWIAYLVEREAKDLIVYPEVQVGARQKAMEALVNRLHFGDKIKIIEELYTGKKDALVKLMRRIQDMRNDIAHGRFDNLTYEGYHLSDNRGKLKLIANLRDVFLKKQ
ncbi:MAG: hypothetical protein WDZ93_00635 [Candidatus Paceibacterota bacterium]